MADTKSGKANWKEERGFEELNSIFAVNRISMILYNVTVNIESDVHDEWLNWMIKTHIPDVLKTGIFKSNKICRIINREHDEQGSTYSIQYICNSMEDYERYQREFAPALQQETIEKYKDKFVAFRTVMEIINSTN